MKTSLHLQRLVAGTMGLLFFGTHCLFAYSTESNIWLQRRKSREQRSSPTLLASLPVALSSPPWPLLQSGGVSLSPTVAHAVPKGFLKDHQELLSALSPAFGTIRKVSLSPQFNRSAPVVIHIQDVHQNWDAQKNIGRLVDSLLTSNQAGLIALEGTWGDIDLQPFRDFPHRQAVELSADYLLKENKISGPIHAILTGTGPLPTLIGVDDSTHYNANVEAYRQSAPLMETTKRILDQRKAALDLEKSRVFTPELKALDSAVEAYRCGQLGLGDYVNTLTNASPELVVPSSVLHFKKTLLMEKTMDFKQVERERADLIGHLVQKLNHQEMDDLTRQSVAYRSNQVSYGDFYSYLQALCHRTGVSLETYPAMQTYVRYVLLADGIQAETLLEDLTTLERNVFSTMAPTSEARALIEQSRVVHLARKLVDFSLTPEEWREYRTLSIMNPGLLSFENFYREADARDHSMAENLLKIIQSRKSLPVSILVTGGYHSQGLTAQLTQAGATVISVVPKIDKMETTQGSVYLSIFAQEKTPLDKLFAGEKLFLAQDPISKVTRQIVAPALVVLTSVLLGQATGLADLNVAFHSLGGLGILSDLSRSSVETVGLTLSFGGTFFAASASKTEKQEVKQFEMSKISEKRGVGVLRDALQRIRQIISRFQLKMEGFHFGDLGHGFNRFKKQGILIAGRISFLVILGISILFPGATLAQHVFLPHENDVMDKGKTGVMTREKAKRLIEKMEVPSRDGPPLRIDWLIFKLQNPDFDPNSSPAKDLRSMGAVALPAIPSLQRVLLDESRGGSDWTVAYEAYRTLLELIPYGGSFPGPLRKFFNETNPSDFRMPWVIHLLTEMHGFESGDKWRLLGFSFRFFPSENYMGKTEKRAERALSRMGHPLSSFFSKHEWIWLLLAFSGFFFLFERMLSARERKIQSLVEEKDATGLCSLSFTLEREYQQIWAGLALLPNQVLIKSKDEIIDLLKKGLLFQHTTDPWVLHFDVISNKTKKTLRKIGVPDSFIGMTILTLGDTIEGGRAKQWFMDNDPSDPAVDQLLEMVYVGSKDQAILAREILFSKMHLEPSLIVDPLLKRLKVNPLFTSNIGRAYEEAIGIFPETENNQDLITKLFVSFPAHKPQNIKPLESSRAFLAILKGIGPKAKWGIPYLIALQSNPLYPITKMEKKAVLVGPGEMSVGEWAEIDIMHSGTMDLSIEIKETMEAIGTGSALEIPALCALLDDPSAQVQKTAEKYLNEVVDTPENIARAYTHALTETPEGSEAYQFALNKGGKPTSIPDSFEQLKNKLLVVAQPLVNFLSAGDDVHQDRPDVFVVSGSNDLRAYVDFFKLWKELGGTIPVVVAGGRGSGTILLARECLSYYGEKLNFEQRDLLVRALPPNSLVTETSMILDVVFPQEGFLEGDRQYFFEETRPSSSTRENMRNVAEIVAHVIDKKNGPKVALVNTPTVLLRQYLNAVEIWQNELGKDWAIQRVSTYKPELSEMETNELIATISRVSGYPEGVHSRLRITGELEGCRDGLQAISEKGMREIRLARWETEASQIKLLFGKFLSLVGAEFDPSVNLMLVPQGKNNFLDGNGNIGSGRATSLWMTRFAEWVGSVRGGEQGRLKAGAHYRDHAPIYEWTLGFTGMVVNFGVIILFTGSGLTGVVAPLLGAVFGCLFFVSHFGKEPKTPINVSVPKAAVMAVIYTALIILSPFPVLEFLEYRSFVSVLLLSLVASWWVGAFALHSHFDKKRSPSNRQKPNYSDLKIISDEHFWLKNFLSYEYELEIRKVELDLPSGEFRSGEKFYRVYARSGDVFVFRKVGKSLSAARSFISTQMNLLPKGKVDHPFVRHVRHYDEKLPEDPFIILWEGVRWSLERFEEREVRPPQGDVLNKLTKQTNDTGRATSLWGVKLAEVLFGKRFGAERAGAVYKRLAPLVGTVSALTTVAMVIGGVALLDGSAVAGVVAPLVGAVFGGIFMMSHSLLPNAWLPKSLSRKDIRFPNVLTMTILYATSITLSPWGIFNVETLGLTSQEIRAIALLSWPAALLTHGFFDGWFRPIMTFVKDLSSSPSWRSSLGKVFGLLLLLPPFLLVGEPSLGGSLAIGGAASGVVGFLPLLFGSMIHQGGPPFSRAPFGHLTVVANVMDVGSYFHGNSVLYERSLPKIKKLLPEYAEMGATEIYLTNGLFTPSEMGKKVHTVPPASPIFVYAGKAISMLGGSYFTKRKWLNGTWFDDRHGSNFSTTDMRVLNPDAFDSPTNEGRWAELAGFVAEARRLGMKVKVDLVPWISPDGITKDNWTWAKYHQKVPEEDRSLSDERILEKHPGNSLVKWDENGQSVRVLVGNFSPGVDQVDPDFNNPGYQAYLMDYLHRLIDAGVESVRVDMAHRLGSLSPNNGWQAWTKVINDAKSYAKAKGQTFYFLMEAYPEGGPDWRGLFLDRFPQEAVYHADPFHNYERIAKGEGEGLMHLKQAMEHARSHPGQWWAFPTNFDEWSLKNMGGPQEAFLALLLIYARLGVPLMVDSRELMAQAGQNIPQAGGQDRDEEGNFRHPFPNVIVRGFRAFWGIFRQSPHRRFLLDMKSFLAEAETIEILDTPNEHRYFAVGIKNRSGAYDVRVWDFYPQWGTPAAWVEAPKSFLSNESVALRWKETEKIRNRRLRNAFVMTDPSLPGGQAPLNLITVSHGPQKWHRFPMAFGPDHVARITIRPVSSGRSHLLPRGKVRDPDMIVFPGSTFRLVMNTPLFRDGGESRVDFQRVENILTLDGNNIPFTSTALNEVRGTPPEIDTSNILALLPNGNLGMNDWFVGFANGTFYHKPREDWEHRTYDMLVQPVEGAPRVQTLRFRLVKGSWKAFDATTNKEETTAIAYAVFGQRIVKDGKNNVENLAEQFDDLRHLFRFPLFELPGNRQWHLGFNDDRGELYEGRQKVTAALKGQSVTLSLKPLHHSKISDVERDEVFAAWGYVRRQTETSPVNLRPGDYVVSADQKSLTVNLLPGIHPHSFIGLSQTGELMAGLVPGQTHQEGTSVDELANRALASGAKDLFLWANGKDAKIVGTGFTGEAEKARPGYLAAIVIERPTPSPSPGRGIASSSTPEPQRVASMVLSELGQRPLNQGVGEFMDQAARKTVETYSQPIIQSRRGVDFLTEDSNGILVVFVDAGSVNTLEKQAALAQFIKRQKEGVIVTNASDLSVPGIAADHLFLRPEVFSPLLSSQGTPLGLIRVSLSKLAGELTNLPNRGGGFRFMQTEVMQLDTENLDEGDHDIVEAAERAWILNGLFQWILPAHSLDWKGIIKTLTAIAGYA